jgi:hypothetical protein
MVEQKQKIYRTKSGSQIIAVFDQNSNVVEWYLRSGNDPIGGISIDKFNEFVRDNGWVEMSGS